MRCVSTRRLSIGCWPPRRHCDPAARFGTSLSRALSAHPLLKCGLRPRGEEMDPAATILGADPRRGRGKGSSMSDNVIKLVPLQELPEESPLVIKCAADIKPEKIEWLWEERLPLGKCVLVAGEGGLGKSMLLA